MSKNSDAAKNFQRIRSRIKREEKDGITVPPPLPVPPVPADK